MSETKTDYPKVRTTCEDCGDEFETAALPHLLAKMWKRDPGDPMYTRCPKCRAELGRIADEEERRQRQAEDDARRQSWLLASGIQRRYRGKTFDQYVPKNENQHKMLGVCRRYAEQFKAIRGSDYPSLVLFSTRTATQSGNGNGKTHLASAIAHHIIDHAAYPMMPVTFVREPDLFSRIRSTYNVRGDQSSDTESSIMDRLCRIPLLIIDDVGKEETNDPRFVQRIWYSLVERRYSDMLPVVLTANLDPDQLNAHFGGTRTSEATFDRLYEMCGGVMYELTGGSHRQQNNSEVK